MKASIYHKILIVLCLLGKSQGMQAAWCSSTSLSSQGAVTPSTTWASVTVASATANGKRLYWSFAGTSGVTYHFDLCSSGATDDAFLRIYDNTSATGNLVASNDDYCGDLPSIDFVCSSTKTYYVLATIWDAGASGCDAFLNNGTVTLTHYICSTSGRSMAFSENYMNASISSASCGWNSTPTVNGTGFTTAAWFMSGVDPVNRRTVFAGGAFPEACAMGDQDCGGCTQTLYMTSPMINTTNVTTMNYSWKQQLYATNLATHTTTVSDRTIQIKVDWSPDNSTWNNIYSNSFVTNTSGTQQLIAPSTATTSNFTPTSNTTYLRYSITGQLFKVWYWCVDNGAPTDWFVLPIEMKDFEARAAVDGVNLNWTTATETNNESFVVERSADGARFESIETIPGAGNSLQNINYSYKDPRPYEGVNYYRIKQTDFNGKFTYSPIKSVFYAEREKWLSDVYPNPASEELNFEVYATGSNQAQISIVDITGRIIYDKTEQVQDGTNKITISLRDFSQGVYSLYVNLADADHRVIRKITKN